MITVKENIQLPHSLEEFLNFEPNDGLKYEWNDGELIKFNGMNKTQLYIYKKLSSLFSRKGYFEYGTFVAEQEVMLTGIQIRKPDIAYFSDAQIKLTAQGEDEIPEFVIEIISGNDNINKVKEKIIEYFKAGVKVVWLIFPESKSVEVYTSAKAVNICMDSDVCSASPVLKEFEITVDELLKLE